MGGPSPLINYRNSKKYSPNMTFFLRTGLGIMSLIDVMGGYAISIAVARKDLNIS